MPDTLVSVIIPTCGRVNYIGQAIQSALDQTVGRAEIVVVDDGSTDGSAERAATFPQVKVLRQDRRTGISVARNRALGVARGEFVVFLDDDDHLLPTAFEVGLRELRARPDVALTFGRARMIDQDGAVRGLSEPMIAATFTDVLRGNYPVHPAVGMLRREAVLAVGGFDVWRGIAQDYEFYTRLARRFPVHAHDEVVSEYRKHDGSVYRTRGATACLASLLEIVDRLRPTLRDADEVRAWRQARARWQALFGPALPWELIDQARRGDLERARDALGATLRHAPMGTLIKFGADAVRGIARRRAA